MLTLFYMAPTSSNKKALSPDPTHSALANPLGGGASPQPKSPQGPQAPGDFLALPPQPLKAARATLFGETRPSGASSSISVDWAIEPHWPQKESVPLDEHKLAALAAQLTTLRLDKSGGQRLMTALSHLLHGKAVDWRRKNWEWLLLTDQLETPWPIALADRQKPFFLALAHLAALYQSLPPADLAIAETEVREARQTAIQAALPLLLPLSEVATPAAEGASEARSPFASSFFTADALSTFAERVLDCEPTAEGALRFAREISQILAQKGQPNASWTQMPWAWAAPRPHQAASQSTQFPRSSKALAELDAPRPPDSQRKPQALRQAIEEFGRALPFYGVADAAALEAARARLIAESTLCWRRDRETRHDRARGALDDIQRKSAPLLPPNAYVELDAPWVSFCLPAGRAMSFLEQDLVVRVETRVRFLAPARGAVADALLEIAPKTLLSDENDRTLDAIEKAVANLEAFTLRWIHAAERQHPSADSMAEIARIENGLRDRIVATLDNPIPAGLRQASALSQSWKTIAESTLAVADESLRVAAASGQIHALDILGSYPQARARQRVLRARLGPPNSGKTHEALEALSKAQTGLFLAPLRLLALEAYDRLRAQGIPCSLMTGEERIIDPKARIVCCTVEMATTSRDVDVAVIDEIQMLADPDRGPAFSRALIGVSAAQVWICGGLEALPALEAFAQSANEKLEIIRTERKLPLRLEPKPIRMVDAQPGDAFVAFSRKAVLAIAAELKKNDIKACVIYGALSPEARREQSRRFRANEAPVLASTDAIGMGLNLPIRRVVFVETEKFDGVSRRNLNASEVRQIAGRAGRYGFGESEGLCAALTSEGVGLIERALNQTPVPLPARLPVALDLRQAQDLANALNTDKVGDVLAFFANAQISDPLFHPSISLPQLELAHQADALCPQMPFSQRWGWVRAPISPDVPTDMALFTAAIKAEHANQALHLKRFLSDEKSAKRLSLQDAETESRTAAFLCWMQLARPALQIVGGEDLSAVRESLEVAVAQGILQGHGFAAALEAAHWLPFSLGARGHGAGGGGRPSHARAAFGFKAKTSAAPASKAKSAASPAKKSGATKPSAATKQPSRKPRPKKK